MAIDKTTCSFYASLGLPHAGFCSYTILSIWKTHDTATDNAVMLPKVLREESTSRESSGSHRPGLKSLELHQGSLGFLTLEMLTPPLV